MQVPTVQSNAERARVPASQKRLGGFVVAVLLEKFQDFRQRHPSSEDNFIFRSLVSPNVWGEIRHRPKISPLVELEHHQNFIGRARKKRYESQASKAKPAKYLDDVQGLQIAFPSYPLRKSVFHQSI
jgi:hypothetical protein